MTGLFSCSTCTYPTRAAPRSPSRPSHRACRMFTRAASSICQANCRRTCATMRPATTTTFVRAAEDSSTTPTLSLSSSSSTSARVLWHCGNPMRASLIAYWAPKEGSSAAEYEDAWRVLPGPADEVPGRWVAVAVADGATESLLARYWAAMVVDGFAVAPISACDARSFAATALALSGRWPAVVDSYIAEREKAARPLRWYERPGIESGAFDTSPALLGSCDTDPGPIVDHVRLAGGTVAEGDDFFVCTDAMAAWFLSRSEEGGKPWETLRDLSEIGFAEWVYEARRTSGLHNDDVTL